MRPVTEVVEAGLPPRLVLELVGVQGHRENRLLTARRRAAMVRRRSSGRHPAGLRRQRAPRRRRTGPPASSGTGAVSVRTQRRMIGPGAVPGRVEPVGDAGILVGDDDPQRCRRRRPPPGARSGCSGARRSRWSPTTDSRASSSSRDPRAGATSTRSASSGAELPRPDDRAVLRRRAHGRPVERREEGVGRLRAGRTAGRSRGCRRRSHPGRSAGGPRPPAGPPPGAPPSRAVAPIRSMESEDATSVSQS